MNRTHVRNTISSFAVQSAANFRLLLAREHMLSELSPAEAERVLDALLNVPRERIERLMDAARESAGAARDLANWS